MNKKGFTLIEVLAVIVVLGLLVVIIVPVVNNLLGDSEDALYDKQVDSIVKATKKYMVEHSEYLPDIGGVNSITISKLIDDGVIDKDKVIDPKTKEQMNGCVVVDYNSEFSQYNYNYSEDLTKCSYISNGFLGDGGLYEAQGEPGRLIFRGANPNNFIALKENGTEVTYRILSFESDGTIKVVRNDSIGNRKWDEDTDRQNTSGGYYCTSNKGCNVWGNQSNTYYSGNSLTSLNQDFYYYYYPNKEATTFSIKPSNAYGTVTVDSTLNIYLNTTWINTLDFKDNIDTHTFNVGGIYYYGYFNNGYSGGDKGLLKEKEEEQVYTWNGKIALMNITEFVETSLSDTCTSVYSDYYYQPNNVTYGLSQYTPKYSSGQWPCALKNWNYKIYSQWFISPNSSNRLSVWRVGATGAVNGYDARDYSMSVRPAFYLKSSVILSGDGSSSNPYKISG